MIKVSLLLLLSISAIAYSQVIPEEEFTMMLDRAQENCVGAHENAILKINEEFAKSIWGKKIRFNEASIIKYFKHPSGEEVSTGVDIAMSNNKSWAYEYDQKTASDLFAENGVRVGPSFNTLWIKANQALVYAENEKEGHKIILELYCPQQSILEKIRTGKTQSIEFLITGVRGSVSSNNKIYGILTQVHTEKQVSKCSNGHEFDKGLGYKFCPSCGEPLE